MRIGGVKIESRQRIDRGRSPEEAWFRRCVERFGTENRHDRYPHRGAMVHLRRRESLATHAPSATTRNAGVPQEKVRSGVNDATRLVESFHRSDRHQVGHRIREGNV